MTTMPLPMPDASVLYTVTGVVVAGLLVWVALVLKTAKEPWARPAPAGADAPAAEQPSEEDLPSTPAGSSSIDADDTARATPVALSEGRAKAAEPASEEPKEEKTSEA